MADAVLRRVSIPASGLAAWLSGGESKEFAIVATPGDQTRQKIVEGFTASRPAPAQGNDVKREAAHDVSKILCPFCSTPWTDDMVEVFAHAQLEHGYYPGDGSSVDYIDLTVDITCANCKRLIYRKECRR